MTMAAEAGGPGYRDLEQHAAGLPNMDTTIGTFQADKEAAFTPKLGEVKPSQIFWGRRRGIDEDTVADLDKALARDGGFLQQIAVRDEEAKGYRLIYGLQRLEAWKRHFGEQTPMPAKIYPPHTPDALIAMIEDEENLFRKELTSDERTVREMRWVAAFKKLNGGQAVVPVSASGGAAESGNPIPILTRARRGRGNKGMAQQVADKFGIGKRAVNVRRRSAAAVIGKEIDFDCDTPEELERKAPELERKADKRQHAEAKAKRPKRKERAPQEVVDDSGEIDSELEEVWTAFSALSERKQLKIMLRACRLRSWALRMGSARRDPVVDEEPAVVLPLKAAPATYDTAVDSQPEQQEGGADVSADDLQHPSSADSHAADQEPVLLWICRLRQRPTAPRLNRSPSSSTTLWVLAPSTCRLPMTTPPRSPMTTPPRMPVPTRSLVARRGAPTANTHSRRATRA
jgi:hypothetical protein